LISYIISLPGYWLFLINYWALRIENGAEKHGAKKHWQSNNK